MTNAAETRARNQRKYTAPEKILSGLAMFFGISPSWPGEITARLVLPLRTKAEVNAHESWRIRLRRSKLHRTVTAQWLKQLGPAEWRKDVVRVVFTRLAPKLLDVDNMPTSTKYVQDQVAAWIAGNNTPTGRGDDGPNSGVSWEHRQEKCTHYGVAVQIYVAAAGGGDDACVAGPSNAAASGT